MISSCVHSNLLTEASSVGRSTFQTAYLFSNLYLSVFSLFGCPQCWSLWTCQLDFNKIFTLHAFDISELLYTLLYTGHTHTISYTHIDWDFWSNELIKRNYALYCGTVLLIVNNIFLSVPILAKRTMPTIFIRTALPVWHNTNVIFPEHYITCLWVVLTCECHNSHSREYMKLFFLFVVLCHETACS